MNSVVDKMKYFLNDFLINSVFSCEESLLGIHLDDLLTGKRVAC